MHNERSRSVHIVISLNSLVVCVVGAVSVSVSAERSPRQGGGGAEAVRARASGAATPLQRRAGV